MKKINEMYRINRTDIRVPHMKGVTREQFNSMFKHLDFNKDKAWNGIQEKLKRLEMIEEMENKQLNPELQTKPFDAVGSKKNKTSGEIKPDDNNEGAIQG